MVTIILNMFVPIRQINIAIHVTYYVHTYYTPSIGSFLELMFLLKKNHYCHRTTLLKFHDLLMNSFCIILLKNVYFNLENIVQAASFRRLANIVYWTAFKDYLLSIYFWKRNVWKDTLTLAKKFIMGWTMLRTRYCTFSDFFFFQWQNLNKKPFYQC